MMLASWTRVHKCRKEKKNNAKHRKQNKKNVMKVCVVVSKRESTRQDTRYQEVKPFSEA